MTYVIQHTRAMVKINSDLIIEPRNRLYTQHRSSEVVFEGSFEYAHKFPKPQQLRSELICID